MSGTRITCEDIETGDSDTAVIENDYLLVTDGTCTCSVQTHANGTHVITIKGRKPGITKHQL